MHKLVVLCKHEPLSRMPDKEFVLPEEFDTSSQAELRALRWLLYRPHDILMLETLEQAVCKHCGVPIHEKEGWVKHRWVHEGGYYACLPSGATKAEPAEPG